MTVTEAQPSTIPVATPVVTGARRTLAVTAAATLVVLAVYASAVTTMAATAHSLDMSVAAQTWALSGISLGLASALLTVGALADELGRRRVLTAGAALLALTSAVAAAAPDTGVFIAARVLQGVAGAAVVAASLALIGQAFPAGAARTHATGVWGAALGAGIALGPVAGALLTSALDWRSSYWLQALAAAALVPAAASIAESRSANARGLDLPGAATLAAGMACLTGGLVEGRTSWAAPVTLSLLAAGALLLAVFALVEVRHHTPMVEPRLFREPLFVASLSGALFTGLGVIGLMSYSPTVLQRGLGVSVLGSGAVLLAWSVTSTAVAFGARMLPSALLSHARLSIGLALTGIGELALMGLGPGSTGWHLVPGLMVAGVGSGVANAALGRLAVESVPSHRAGMGSGANNTARYLGASAGVALVVVVVSAAGGHGADATGLVHGWNAAAAVSAGFCALGALVAACCRAKPARSA